MIKHLKIKILVILVVAILVIFVAISMSKPKTYSYGTNNLPRGNMGGGGKCIGILYPVISKNMEGWKCLGIKYDTFGWVE